jgi:hypothetical protein
LILNPVIDALGQANPPDERAIADALGMDRSAAANLIAGVAIIAALVSNRPESSELLQAARPEI